jgi:peptidyl-prolyl cis-trans isomerase A (cyclophilin A)
MKLLHALLLAACGAVAHPQAPTTDGLYARFTTSMGTFHARLDHQHAPRTVANFISLAEGSRPWLDFPRAQLSHRPFYTGITFHRVIAGFVIQGGSPNGQGTDGPGYQFQDEFHPTLRHNQAGILSMANSGPHSNGSQFFITLGPTPHLDGKHTVFGEVIEGLEVVERIGETKTGPGDRPIQDVRIESIDVLRG